MGSKTTKNKFELGGNDPIIICDDVDIEIAAKALQWEAFKCGQVCTSLERVFVIESAADAFAEAVVEEAGEGTRKSMRTNDMGPMASKMQLQKYIK